MLNEKIRQSIEESVLCWLATASADGRPNVSPKELFVASGDDKLLIANLASPTSVENIASNAHVCVSFVHVFKQKGFKLVGQATIIDKQDERFASRLEAMSALRAEVYPVRGIIEVTVEACEPIVAPSYWLYADTTEEGQVEQAMGTYGVRPGS